MKEYALEDGREVDLEALRTGFVSDDDYSVSHRTMCFACHDILVRLNGKYLLVNRDNVPAKNVLWPLGGRISRGVDVAESLRDKVRKEAGLELSDLRFLGVARTLFETDPWGHGTGTDTVNLMYVADGEGEMRLDHLHSDPQWISVQEFYSMRESLHPYVVEMFEKALS